MRNSLCFVLVPSGRKLDAGGRSIDFDAVYQRVLQPAIARAGLEPLRGGEEAASGIIRRATFEQLVLCAYAVVDLTVAGAGAFYELGVRHALRPWRTVTVFADGSRLPFDVRHLEPFPYRVDASGQPASADPDRDQLAYRLAAARNEPAEPGDDSPVFQLLDYLPRTQVPHEKTDLFRARAKYSEEARRALVLARKQRSVVAVQGVLRDLGRAGELGSGVLVDAMLSYRALKAWRVMVERIDSMPRELQDTAMVQEQRAFALNRDGRGEEAERVLLDVLEGHGPSPETLGLLGRVYKDRWEAAEEAGRSDEAGALLRKAVQTYLQGFEADFRDAYPGVNAVTLMEVSEPPDPRREELLPVVRYAVKRRMAVRAPDYWDHATLLELAALARDEAALRGALADALASTREPWEVETTARNLSLIRKARERRATPFPAADEAERSLRQKLTS